ncbi:hypothetical protein JXO59_08575 [candidate division KSB1 bacterium]|nr:hypothetical protein [candidate division KSB1 bacterium]
MNWHKTSAMAVASIVCFYFSSCNQPTPNAPTPVNIAHVFADISLPKSIEQSATITRAVFLVTAADMDTIREEIQITGMGHVTAELKVPAGNERLFSATLLQDTLAVLYGQDMLDLKSGQHLELKMTLQFLVPALSLSPIDTTAARDDLFTVYINAHRVDSLCTIGTQLLFDPTKVQVVDIGRDDDFLKTNGGAIAQLQFTKDNNAGRVKLVLGIFPAAKAVSGSGRIAHVVFKALEGPDADLILSLDNQADADLGLYDNMANLLYAVALGSKITIN